MIRAILSCDYEEARKVSLIYQRHHRSRTMFAQAFPPIETLGRGVSSEILYILMCLHTTKREEARNMTSAKFAFTPLNVYVLLL